MNIDALLEQIIREPATMPDLIARLSDEVVTTVVDRLKSEADRHWWINANRSLELAALIVQIGQLRDDNRHIALGMMARGDALKLLGRTAEAWEALGQAGGLFESLGDEVGWARTRIGRLLICVDLNRVAEALTDAERARTILTEHNVYEKRLVLDLNTAIVHGLLGDHCESLLLFRSALTMAEKLGDLGKPWLGPLHMDIGIEQEILGDFRQALAHQELARALFVERDEVRGIALTELNSAHIVMAQGHYRRALQLLHQARDRYLSEQLWLDATHVGQDMVECYLQLNRAAEARELANQVIQAYHAAGVTYQEALTLLHLATAEAELAHFAAAQAALDTAEQIFTALDAAAWISTLRMRRGRIALQQGDVDTARREAFDAAAYFEATGQRVNFASATLLSGQALLACQDLGAAAQAAAVALHSAQDCNVPPLRYSAHLLLGRIAETQGRLTRAARRYSAAIATVERVQRALTITLRPGFLEDKGEALKALLALQLREGRAAHAFETLERAKSQTLLSYLANHEQLRWTHDDPHSRALIAELNQLREEHQWFYRLMHNPAVDAEQRPSGIDPDQAEAEVATREQRMRAITEQLYLRGGNADQWVQAPTLGDIQRSLPADTLLIEYYNDGARLWAFTIDVDSFEVHLLPGTATDIEQLLAKLQANLAFALNTGPRSPSTHRLAGITQHILRQLHTALLSPLAARVRERSRLVVVPYGALHYLPFHLLHDGMAYLIERHEVVVQPAASMVTRRVPARGGGARVLAHSLDGQLPHTLAEAHIVHRLFGGAIYSEQAATRAVLRAKPTTILHIATHGEHRLDQPDLSYVQLADGQLYADDLLQQNMSYELVTLSACETGRANVAARDELIGLGRGFLYAGAGALVTSLWRVADDAALDFMERFYGKLHGGASKAAALRTAQRSMLAEKPELHPAFWGAFQLVGEAGPLMATSDRSQITNHEECDAALVMLVE